MKLATKVQPLFDKQGNISLYRVVAIVDGKRVHHVGGARGTLEEAYKLLAQINKKVSELGVEAYANMILKDAIDPTK